jgi:Skp family chaperone for outer membrane proteins
VNIERVADESVVGKALAGRVDVLNQQKAGELNEKRNALQAAQQKLESAASVLSPNALVLARKDIERQQIDIQRFTEDAQADNPRPARTAPERVRGPGALTLNQDGQLVTCRSRERRIKSYCS